MSRSGYCDDLDPLQLGRWRAIISSATQGRRGQRFFRELAAALDAMPEKRLVAGHLQTTEGEVCALGALGRHKAVPLGELDTYNYEQLGDTFDIAKQLSQEVMYENDEAGWNPTPERRWELVRKWAASQIIPTEEELRAEGTT